MRPLAQPPVAPKTRAMRRHRHRMPFFLGINTVSTKLADPYGHDLDDLRILSHCKLMPGACKSILTPELPAGTHANLDT